MLKELRCNIFNRTTIFFHPGLNVILGDDDAKNSIGKSTILMVIDFILGGSTFLNDDAGVIREMGHHHYDFAFEFAGALHHFSRDTVAPQVVHQCDADYARIGELELDAYLSFLKTNYALDPLEGSFRSSLNPFLRIWKKGGLDTDHPFSAVANESAEKGINRLVDMFGYSADVAAERLALEKLNQRMLVIKRSMKEELIPNVSKTRYKDNLRLIAENSAQIENLKQGLTGAINTYELLFDLSLQELRNRKRELNSLLSELQTKSRRLQREISGITPRVIAPT